MFNSHLSFPYTRRVVKLNMGLRESSETIMKRDFGRNGIRDSSDSAKTLEKQSRDQLHVINDCWDIEK